MTSLLLRIFKAFRISSGHLIAISTVWDILAAKLNSQLACIPSILYVAPITVEWPCPLP